MAAPTTATLDTFVRANGALGANWGLADHTLAESTIISDLMSGAASVSTTAGWIATNPFAANQETWAKGYLHLGEVDLYGRGTNINSTSTDGYKLILDQGGVRLGLWTIVNDFITTQLGSFVTGLSSITGTWLSCIGSTITGYTFSGSTWTQQIQVTDSTYTTGGFIGIDTSSGTTPVTISTFGGGAVVSTTSIPNVNFSTPVVA